MLKVGPEEVGYVAKILGNPEERGKFWREFASSCPTLYSCIESVCNAFMVTHAPQMPEQAQLATAHVFMSHAIFIFGALYAANGKKFPRVTEDKDQIAGMVANCGSLDEIARREKFFAHDVSEDWIREFMAAAKQNRFCMHGIAPIYALAEAFVKSAEAESASAAIPAEVAERAGPIDPRSAREMEERKLTNKLALWPSVRAFMESDA